MKGMQKIKRGSGFKGVISYVLGNDNGELDGQIIGGNLSGTEASSLNAEFLVSRKLRPDVEKPVWHNSLRLPAGDKLTTEEWCVVADDYMQRMGFTDFHQRAYVLHDESDGQHIHIVASRIGLDGQLYLGKNENLLSTQHIHALELEHGLTITKGQTVKDGRIVAPDIARPKPGEVGHYERTGKQPVRYQLISIIDKALEDNPSASVFAECLALAGVEARANFAGDKLNGFSFSLNGVSFKGSNLGKQYTGKALFERGLNYEKNRDFTKLKRLSAAYSASGVGTAAAENSPNPGTGIERRELNASSLDSNKGKQPFDGRGYATTMREHDYTDTENGVCHFEAKRVDKPSDEVSSSDTTGGLESNEQDSATESPGEGQQPAVSKPQHFATNPYAGGDGFGSVDVKEATDIITTNDPLIDKMLRKMLAALRSEEQKKIAKTKQFHEESTVKVRAALNGKKDNSLSRFIDNSFTFIAKVRKSNIEKAQAKNAEQEMPPQCIEPRDENAEKTSNYYKPKKERNKNYVPAWRRRQLDDNTPELRK